MTRPCFLVAIAAVLLVRPVALADGPGLPNLSYPDKSPLQTLSAIGTSVGAPRGHGFVTMHRGYLLVPFASDGGGGGTSGGFAFLDISYPANPFPVFTTNGTAPYNNSTSNQYAGRIRESHGWTISGDIWCMTTNGGGSGLQFWNLANPTAPVRLSELNLSTLTGGDYSPTAWWVSWQGRYAYVASTTGGLHIVDATDPANPTELSRIPTGSLGGFRVNVCFAIGNLLVIGMSDGSGIATFDIGNPANPVLLGLNQTAQMGYSGMVNGNRIYGAHDPARVYDISDPTNITLLGSGPNVAGKGGYGTFKDGRFVYGSSSHVVRLDTTRLPFAVVDQVSPPGFSGADWDFGVTLGNLVFAGNDHSGSALLVGDTTPDTVAPEVNMVNPPHGKVNAPLTSRVGITLTDQVLTESVGQGSFIVRPVGGAALAGVYTNQTGILNFWPDHPLESDTTYEVVATAGGIKDLAGNGLGTTFLSRFSTGAEIGTIGVKATSSGPTETGGEVTFTATPSGPAGSPEYSWDFGDGSAATPFSADPVNTHSYGAPGNYAVQVTMRDGATTARSTFQQLIHRPLTATAPVASSSIVFDPANRRVWNTNPDNGTVTAVDADNFTKLYEIPVGENPQTLALGPSNELWVANQGGDSLTRINRSNGGVLGTVPLGHGSGPSGIVFSPDLGTAYVTLFHAGKISRIDAATRAVTGSLDLGRTPGALGVTADGARILVARFISPDSDGEVLSIDTAAFDEAQTVSLTPDPGPDTEASGRGLPNYLSGIAISPDGGSAWVAAKKDNIARGTARDGLPLDFESTVRSIAAKILLPSGEESPGDRVDFNDRDAASAVAFSKYGNYVFVATRGTNTVEVVDAYEGTHFGSILAGGLAPRGIAVNPEGTRLFVHNHMSRSVTAFGIGAMCGGACGVTPLLATVPTVSAEKLAPQVLAGKRIFYNAADRRMNRDSYISCASCHLDGDHDGRTWDFTDRGEGLRNTPTLLGRRGLGHGRLHWSANFDEIQDFEHDIRGSFGGEGFMTDADFQGGNRHRSLGGAKAGKSAELDALAAYLTSLSATPKSPHRRADGGMTASAAAGAVFFASRCATCHSGPDFTDSPYGALHDVGTLRPASGKRLGLTLPGIDTPGLRGAWATAPYLHDGSAADLMAVITSSNPADKHGVTSDLSPAELGDLEQYLLQLDDSTPAYQASPPPVAPNPDGDGIPAAWEEMWGADPYADDGGMDSDDDSLTNAVEYLAGTNPENPDTDGDGLSDGAEVAAGTNPLDPADPAPPLTALPLSTGQYQWPDLIKLAVNEQTSAAIDSLSGHDVDRDRDQGQTFTIRTAGTIKRVAINFEGFAANAASSRNFVFEFYKVVAANDPVRVGGVISSLNVSAADITALGIPNGGQGTLVFRVADTPVEVGDTYAIRLDAPPDDGHVIKLRRDNSGGTYTDGQAFGSAASPDYHFGVYGTAIQLPPNYSSWIAGFSGLGSKTAPGDDPDGDDVPNAVENVFGTSPAAYSQGLRALSSQGGDFVFTHPQGVIAADLRAEYRWSTDLVTFHGAGETAGGIRVDFSTQPETPSPGHTTVTATATGTVPKRLFVIIAVTRTE